MDHCRPTLAHRCRRGAVTALKPIAVLNRGDSDSTGVIVGYMLVMPDPLISLQHRWTPAIERADIINHMVLDYLQLRYGRDGFKVLGDSFPEY